MAERKNTQLAVSAGPAPANYEELFQLRGATYDGAMARFPEARREEFLNTIARAALAPGALVADVPAGGGYLARYLPEGCTWLGHEPCASFGHGATEQDRDLLPLPWAEASIDAALSIAGVHHLDDKMPLSDRFGDFVEIHTAFRCLTKSLCAAAPRCRFGDRSNRYSVPNSSDSSCRTESL